MFKEFKEFALRGNALDMAVGIVLGAAFGKMINSFVSDILMPPIGWLLGRVDFSNLAITIHQKTTTTAAVTFRYGLFINSIVSFVIVAFAMFLFVRQINLLMKPWHKPTEVTTKNCPYCCSTISMKATRCPQCTSEIR